MIRRAGLAGRSSSTDYERSLFERVSGWTAHWSWKHLAAEELSAISVAEGIDFATTLLYQRLLQSPEHGPFIQQLESISGLDVGRSHLNADIVIVPGAFYGEYPNTGADGRALRDVASEFGCTCEMIPLPSFGRLLPNARTICDWLANRLSKPVVLVSLSKGGADVKIALAQRDADHAFRNVRVWINMCGLVNGTPLVSWIAASRIRTMWYRFLLGLRGYDFQVVRELTSEPGGPLDCELEIPGHIQAIHAIGFPLKQHLTDPLARRCFCRLKPLGPNDGSVVLADVCRLPGIVYPVWGADHYLRPASGDVRILAIRVFRWLAEGGLCHAETKAANRVDLAERPAVPPPGRDLRTVSTLHATDVAHIGGAGASRTEGHCNVH